MTDYIYDIESYRNIWTCAVQNSSTGKSIIFECSPWKNEWKKFLTFMERLGQSGARMVGFNNTFYDYPVLHWAMEQDFDKQSGEQIARRIKQKSDEIIQSGFHNKWEHVVYDNRQKVRQIDLLRVHHFDNPARATSLKALEFNMRSDNVSDLPFHPDHVLTEEEAATLRTYNMHDVAQTTEFYRYSAGKIKFREELTTKFGKNMLNHNDTKIGKDFLVMELEKAGVTCYSYDNGRREPVQTHRSSIWLEDIIFPYVKFERPEFNAILTWFKQQKIRQTKGVFTEIDPDTLGELEKYTDLTKKKGRIANLNCIVDGVKYVFGTGGIHASVESTVKVSDETFVLMDYDVTSYYPSLAIVNEVYPEHMSATFCEIYEGLKNQRVGYARGTAENAMLKLALNGTYGASNDAFSPFYDPKFTMSITVNGQLLLCMLAEQLLKVPDLKIVQLNTDGVTVHMRRDTQDQVDAICKAWMDKTKLDLEEACYSHMFIRDVNNYIAVYDNGKVKCKGAYETRQGLMKDGEMNVDKEDWHKNHSAMIIPKAVEAALVNGVNVREFIENHDDVMDFMLFLKVPRTSKLELVELDGAPLSACEKEIDLLLWFCRKFGVFSVENAELARENFSPNVPEEKRIISKINRLLKFQKNRNQAPEVEAVKENLQTTSRGYASTDGRYLIKVMPPLPKNPNEWREMAYPGLKGQPVTPMNIMGEVKNIDYDYYVSEAMKLIDPLMNGWKEELM